MTVNGVKCLDTVKTIGVGHNKMGAKMLFNGQKWPRNCRK